MIRSAFLALAVSVAALAPGVVPGLSAPAAQAQTTVVVIDQMRIMRESRAGKDVQAKLKSIESTMKGELEPTRKQLETERASIEARTQGKTREQVAQDTALRSQVQAFATKGQTFQRDANQRAQDLALTEQTAWSSFFEQLQPVLQEVVAERRAQIMLDRSQAVYVDPQADVTALVIQKLDQRTPSISVTRQRAPVRQAAVANR